jgi:hypothetical protein
MAHPTCHDCKKELTDKTAHRYDTMALCNDCQAVRFWDLGWVKCYKCHNLAPADETEPVIRKTGVVALCRECFKRSHEARMTPQDRESFYLRMAGIPTRNPLDRLISEDTAEILLGCARLTGQSLYQCCKQIRAEWPEFLPENELTLVQNYARRYGERLQLKASTRRPGYYSLTHEQAGQEDGALKVILRNL